MKEGTKIVSMQITHNSIYKICIDNTTNTHSVNIFLYYKISENKCKITTKYSLYPASFYMGSITPVHYTIL